MERRKVRYRAWDKKNKEMILDYKIKFIEGIYNYSLNDEFADEEYVFMQYTGLDDKNGKEIYEGDIVANKHNLQFVVEYVSGKFKFVEDTKSAIIFMANLNDENNKQVEVIGNIYENPDLLTKN